MVAPATMGEDLAFLRFDLEACPLLQESNPPQSALATLIGSDPGSGGLGFSLTRPVLPPDCAFTHYDIPLDASWTRTDANGVRPAKPSDFAADLGTLRLPGNFYPGGGPIDLALDNLILERAR